MIVSHIGLEKIIDTQKLLSVVPCVFFCGREVTLPIGSAPTFPESYPSLFSEPHPFRVRNAAFVFFLFNFKQNFKSAYTISHEVQQCAASSFAVSLQKDS